MNDFVHDPEVTLSNVKDKIFDLGLSKDTVSNIIDIHPDTNKYDKMNVVKRCWLLVVHDTIQEMTQNNPSHIDIDSILNFEVNYNGSTITTVEALHDKNLSFSKELYQKAVSLLNTSPKP